MKHLLALALLLSLAACGPGMRARTTGAGFDQEDTGYDGYYSEEGAVTEEGEQLELDLGDQPELNNETINNEIEAEPQLNLFEQTGSADPNPAPNASDVTASSLRPHSSDISAAATLKPTIYFLPTNERNPYRACSSGDVRALKAPSGSEIVPGRTEIKVCTKFYYAVQMEGSGLVTTRNGKQFLINYVGVEGGLPRFKSIDRNVCPYGLGKSNLCLQPFISIAADRHRYKLGDVIYVPAVANLKLRLPDGDVHRGFFIVTDTGNAINGPGRFDFFTGPLTERDIDNPFRQLGLQSKANVTGMKYHLVERGSRTQKEVLEYYKGRQIIPYKK